MHKDIERIGELANDAVFLYDLDKGTFIYVNEIFLSMFGSSKEQLMESPRSLLTLIQSEDEYYLQHCYEELLQKGSVSGTEFRIKLLNGVVKQLSSTAYMLESALVAGFIRDITNERQHDDYIINYGAKKDTLLDMMTHNLSGPLSLSQDIIRWMQDHSSDRIPAEVWSQINLIKANTQECLDIVNDFLKQEHLESEFIYVKKSRFDVLSRIVETLDKLIETNKNKKFRLITSLENLNINTDSVKFFQIVHNLVSNAVRFTADGGNIDIIVEETEETFIIRVKDDGIGIPEDLHKVLFDKRTTARRGGPGNQLSTGLGLSIVKNLTDLLGGSITFQTEVGKGTEFSVEFPKA